MKICVVTYHGPDINLHLAGRRLFATHHPHYARGLACTGDYDVVCCGHSHEASVVQQPTIGGGMTWLVNPGSVAGLGAAATWLPADLASFEFEIRQLD
jgi:predicted phosphodiesterase